MLGDKIIMELLMGLDVGTTATKALLFDKSGNLVASSTHNYGLLTPHENWVEQDPEDFWNAVVMASQEVLKHLSSDDTVLAVSISSQAGTTIPVDAKMQPLCNAISWMDNRAVEQAENVQKKIGAEEVYKKTGWELFNGLPLQHIAWLRDKKTELFRDIRYFLFVNDFILHRLSGELFMNPSDAGITQLYNVKDGCWDKGMLEIAGIKLEQLSPIHPSGAVAGHITKKASEETGLPESTLVVNGAHDQYCAALGTGVLETGSAMLSCGTAWVILCVMNKLKLDPKTKLSISSHVLPNLWGALRSLGAVGASMEWFIDNVWQSKRNDKNVYNEINKGVIQSDVGSNRLFFIPLTGGHVRTPRGTFSGLTLSHSPNDMARAVMEGITFELRWVIEEIRQAGIKAEQLKMVGGAAESPIWPQIVADITNIPVVLPEIKQAAGCGAAILAGFGCGIFSSLKEGYDSFRREQTNIIPNQNNVSQYNELFDSYKIIFNLLSIFKNRFYTFDRTGKEIIAREASPKGTRIIADLADYRG